MCYEESFFQRWARKRAQRRQNVEAAVERDRRKQATQPQPAPAPATANEPKKSRETERDVEVV